MLKEGDTLTLSAGYPLKIDEFQYLKTHASVTRKLSDDVAGDLREMDQALRLGLRCSMVTCIEELSEIVMLLDEVGGDIDALAEKLVQELDHVAKVTHIEVETGDGGGTTKGGTKKAAKKKVTRKKRA